MLVRRLKTLGLGFSFVLGSFALLAGCDTVSENGVTGVWTGTATFEADSIIAEQNLRIFADYTADFVFTVTDDDGLISGSVTADFSGMRITQEAGFAPDTSDFAGGIEFDNDLFGTFIDPELEMDVPDGPYEANLWTFNVVGSRADLNEYLTNTIAVTMSDSTEYTFEINSNDMFEIELQD